MFLEKQKNFTFGTKISYMYIFRPESRKTIVTFKISPLESVRILSFDAKKERNFKFGSIIVLFGYFRAAVLKNYCHM